MVAHHFRGDYITWPIAAKGLLVWSIKLFYFLAQIHLEFWLMFRLLSHLPLFCAKNIYLYIKKSKSRLLKQMSMANANTVCVTYTLIQSHFKHVQSTFMMFRSSSELHRTSICRISMWYIGYIESIITPIFPCG